MHTEMPPQYSDQYHASEPPAYASAPPHDQYYTSESLDDYAAPSLGTASLGPPDDMHYQQDDTYPKESIPADHYYAEDPEYGYNSDDWMQDY